MHWCTKVQVELHVNKQANMSIYIYIYIYIVKGILGDVATAVLFGVIADMVRHVT